MSLICGLSLPVIALHRIVVTSSYISSSPLISPLLLLYLLISSYISSSPRPSSSLLSYPPTPLPIPQPKMDGPTATRAIRTELGVQWLVFGVTGNGLDSDQKIFLDAGVDQVLIKPLYLADFERAMVRHLSGEEGSGGGSEKG